MDVPFVLTVAVEENAFLFFNALRKIYHPQGNFKEAHLTLFHLLPNESAIIDTIETLSKQTGPLLLHVSQPSLTGNGVVYEIDCPQLVHLHDTLRQQWNSFLIPQDQEKLWPHVTVQDKVPSEEAKELLRFLQGNFSAFDVKAIGLQLWEYGNGPWKLFRQFDFVRN
jgi:hypothetical protein